MNKREEQLRALLAGIMVAVCILLVTILGAEQVEQSKLYRQSQVVSSFFSQDSLNISSFFTDPKQIDTLVKFVGAVTSAYINFELIPVNEANTFMVIFESLNDNIDVSSFEYHGKNLTIYGAADSVSDYERFLRALRNRNYFDSVAGHHYMSTDDSIRFEIECTAAVGSVTVASWIT